MQTIKIVSVNISEKKGTVKEPVDAILLNQHGVNKDAHSGPWHRQVSLLGKESFDKFSIDAKRTIAYGEFAENITTEGVLLYKTSPLDVFKNEHIELMVTQIGKKCHGDACAIFREVGNCVMPKEGIFAKVIRGGTLKPGDLLEYHPRIYKIRIISLNEGANKEENKDVCGSELEKIVKNQFNKNFEKVKTDLRTIPYDPLILKKLVETSRNDFDAVITTGGTGIGPREITPEVIKPLLDIEIPGIMEIIRVRYGMEKPKASLNRSVAGIMGSTLVYTLPGSVKAIHEYMDEILKTFEYLIYIQNGIHTD